MSEGGSISVHAVLLACAVVTVLAVIMWRAPGSGASEAGVPASVSAAFSTVAADLPAGKDESRVPVRN